VSNPQQILAAKTKMLRLFTTLLVTSSFQCWIRALILSWYRLHLYKTCHANAGFVVFSERRVSGI